MGYPGDEGGRPPDTRAGSARRTALWAPDTDQEWPPQASGRPGDAATFDEPPRYSAPSEDAWGPAAASGQALGGPPPAGYPARQPTSRHYPNASAGQPTRPPQPGAAGPAGSPERGRATHRRAPGPGSAPAPTADSRPPSGADLLPGRDNRGRGAARPAGRAAAPPPAGREAAASRENAWRRPPQQRSGNEIQGGTRPPGPAGPGPRTGGSLWSSGAFRTAGPSGRGPVRGFPPAPGAPDPVYPPGQFSPWNSAELRTAAGRANHSAGLGPDLGEPGYSQLAVSDPAADATATQTWAVLDEAQLGGEWTTPAAKAPSPADARARGPFDAADPAAASPAWYTGQPGAAEPAGLTGPAAFPGQRPDFPGQRPDPAPRGQPGPPDSPRPGSRVAARRSREAAQDMAPDTTLAPGTGGGPGTARDLGRPGTAPDIGPARASAPSNPAATPAASIRVASIRAGSIPGASTPAASAHRPKPTAGPTAMPAQPGRRGDPGPPPAGTRHASRASRSAGPGCGSCQPACWSWSVP